MRPEIDETLLTAYALGELDARERGRVAAHVEADAEARRYVEEVRETAGLITDHLALEPADGLTPAQHQAIERRLREVEAAAAAIAALTSPMRIGPSRATRVRQWLPLAASIAASIAIVLGSLAVLLPWMYPNRLATAGDDDDRRDASWQIIRPGDPRLKPDVPDGVPDGALVQREDGGATNALPDDDAQMPDGEAVADEDWEPVEGMVDPRSTQAREAVAQDAAPPLVPVPAPAPKSPDQVASSGGPATSGDAEDLRTGDNRTPGPAASPSPPPSGSPGTGYRPRDSAVVSPPDPTVFPEILKHGTVIPESPKVYENPFRVVAQRPRSAFPVKVETGSYKVVRNHLLERKLPPPHLVRVEELVNRFRYGYAPPADPDAALVANVEIAACPWNVQHRLARIAIKAREGGAMVVARGVEVGVEFNPIATAEWRLIGYENAPAAAAQPANFAADLAAAGTATAFYEIVPTSGVDARAATRNDLFTLSIRYRDPADNTPNKLALTATDAGQGFDRASPDFRFAASVAAFGMLLRESQFKGTAGYPDVIRWATSARGPDETFERAAFIDLARFALEVVR